MNVILVAAQYATQKHKGQVRKWCGEPYIRHPGRVAARLMEFDVLDVDEDQVAAAWLHDVVEDCGCDYEDISWVTNSRVAQLVADLTNTSKQLYPAMDRAGRKAIDHDRLANVSAAAKRIKLLDRLDNLRDLDLAPLDFACLYLRESAALLDVLRGGCPLLEAELEQEIARWTKELAGPGVPQDT